MAFEILLQIPKIKTIVPLSTIEDRTAGFLDDDPYRPLFLTRVSEIFHANGVKFEIRGCPIGPLSASSDLPFFLEDLPGLIDFLKDPTKMNYTLCLMEQGTEAELKLSKVNGGNDIEVQTMFPLKTNAPQYFAFLSHKALKNQVVNFIMSYKNGIIFFYPECINEPWNQNIFSFARSELASD